MSMTRSTSVHVALAITASSPLLAIEPAAVGCPAAEPEAERELCRFRPYVVAPALVAESLVPSDETSWWGGGVRLVLYGWSDNNERPGPGQGAIFTQFSMLGRSGSDDHLYLMRAGATLSFERNAARRWLIPYYGVAAGAMHEDRGTHGLVEATVGAYLLHSRHLVVAVDGGYLLPFSQIEELGGFHVQLSLTAIPW
jgi:hypothetical protein